MPPELKSEVIYFNIFKIHGTAYALPAVRVYLTYIYLTPNVPSNDHFDGSPH